MIRNASPKQKGKAKNQKSAAPKPSASSEPATPLIPPTDIVTLTFHAEKDGGLKVTSANTGHTMKVLPAEKFVLRWTPQGILCTKI